MYVRHVRAVYICYMCQLCKTTIRGNIVMRLARAELMFAVQLSTAFPSERQDIV